MFYTPQPTACHDIEADNDDAHFLTVCPSSLRTFCFATHQLKNYEAREICFAGFTFKTLKKS
jgi:hypothetical protein